MPPATPHPHHPPPARRRGAALVVVLWVIGLLSVIVASFAFEAHVEKELLIYYRKRTRAEALARSGLPVAEMLMTRANKVKQGATDEEKESRWYDAAKRLADGLPLEGASEPLGDGTITLSIVPEPARRSVNALTEEDWERIFELSGIPEDYWPDLVDSFFDWTDKDDDVRRDGAETDDYYSTLDPARHAKNDALDTVGELRLVRGFNPTILYGGILETNSEDSVSVTGFNDLLTTYGDGKVNVNAASSRVLLTLPDMDEDLAGAIIEERTTGETQGDEDDNPSFKSVDDLFARITELPATIRSLVTTDSTIYRVTSVGEVGGVRRQVRAIVSSASGKLTVLRWREQD